MFDGRWRAGVEKGVAPVGTGLRRSGISADQLTAAGLLMSAMCAVAVGSGRLGLGVALLVLASLPDLLDGAVAKASGTTSLRGAFFDSVADRITDSFLLGGIAWYLAEAESGRAAVLALAVLAVSNFISYERAKAESLGFIAKGGLMERAERIVLLGAGLVFSVALVPILWTLLVLSSFTAVQRFFKVWRQASAQLPDRPPRPATLFETWSNAESLRLARARRQAVAERWRARREEARGRRRRQP